MLQLGFGRIVTTIPRRFIDRCRNVDFSSDEQCPVFYPCLKSRALHPESSVGTCGAADDPIRILGKVRVRIRSFRKNI